MQRSLRVVKGWWRRQTPARQDRFATIAPLISVLLFLAAIISAFWYLRNEEFEREQEAVLVAVDRRRTCWSSPCGSIRTTDTGASDRR